MQQTDAINLALKLAKSGKKHTDYDRVVRKADEYMKMITGEGIASLLIRFVQRESEEMFKQRITLTQSTTPAIFSSIMKAFYKASRNDKIIKRFDFKDTAKDEIVKRMIAGFYGSKRRKSRGMDYWFKNKWPSISFFDPNSWIVTEWSKPDPDKEAEPHPFYISSAEAVNFEFKNEELQWLFGQFAVMYSKVDDKGEINEETPGTKWILYDQDFTIAICPVCLKEMAESGRELQENEILIKIADKDYIQAVYEPKLGYVPADRTGYMEDGFTNGRTMVSPAEPAMPFMWKSLKTVSELDLSMTLHAFPQKLQYVEKCQGISREKRCHAGYVNGTSTQCESCKGSGYKIHTTAQDAILLPMPESKEEQFDLNNMLVYKSPPIDLLTFQDTYTKGLKQEAHLAVFNSQIFINPVIAKTATEIDDNMQSVYDTLEPYTEKISEVYVNFVNTFAHLAAVDNPEEKENIHRFPADLKLKTTTILLNELKLVNDSGAPSFMRDAIGVDLASIIYTGDDLGYSKYSVKHKFFPFNGKNPDEIAMLMASQYVSEFTKILYSNFESIFVDIELENPGFWFMRSYSKQWTILEKKVFEYIEELKQDEPVRIGFGDAVDPGTSGDGEDASEGSNPGDGGEDEDTEEGAAA